MSHGRRTIARAGALASVLLNVPVVGAPPVAPVRAAAASGPVVAGRAGAVIDRTIADLGRFWGAVAVARDGEPILLKGYGRTSGADLTADHHFDLGDAGASFTAAAVLLLRDDGRLALDDPIGAHLPDVPTDKQAITIRHLLMNTSGVDPDAALGAADPIDRQSAVRTMLAAAPKHEPGTAYEESKLGYLLLAAIIEHASGESFEAFLRSRLFLPSGMASTGFVDGEHLDPGMDTDRVYSLYGHPISATTRDDTWDWTQRGATGVVTTARDLLRWDRALRDDRVLGAESRTELFTPGVNGWAMGWYVETLFDGTRQATRTGRARGYETRLLRSLDRDAIVVVLGRSGAGIDAAQRAATACLFVDEPETIDATIFTRRQPRDEHGTITLDEARWRVEPTAEGVLLLLGLENRPPALEVRMKTKTAERLLAELEGAIRTVGIDEQQRVGVEAFLFPQRYVADEERRVPPLPPLATWMVTGAYRGVEGGVEVVDERVTIILTDEVGQSWPVTARTAKAEAVRLRYALMDAIRGD